MFFPGFAIVDCIWLCFCLCDWFLIPRRSSSSSYSFNTEMAGSDENNPGVIGTAISQGTLPGFGSEIPQFRL